MIEIVDTLPDVNVQAVEYKRLLGYPRDWVLRDRASELAAWARDWYSRHGRPWVYARQSDTLDTANGAIAINGVDFTSPRLLRTLREAGANSAILAAVGAGPEIEQEAQRLWQDEKPDEYFFLEVYGSAVVEHLITMTGARLCAWADRGRLAVLPHYSPGYPEWEIVEQPRLLDLIKSRREGGLPYPLEVLESGMLRPKKSLLAVFGVTAHTDRVRRLTDLIPCDNCSFLTCQYRRAPYRGAPTATNPELPGFTPDEPVEAPPAIVALEQHAKYSVNAKALRRWADERLRIERRPDGTVHAFFRFDGTTCSNMGRPLQFHYYVTLGAREEGYPIREQQCGPAPGDAGHTHMCRYMNNREHLMVAIETERPLQGQPLNDVLAWTRPACSSGCYCEPSSRHHKWGLVLETIHYALARDERPETLA